jgi:hypothetical protein
MKVLGLEFPDVAQPRRSGSRPQRPDFTRICRTLSPQVVVAALRWIAGSPDLRIATRLANALDG